MPATTLTASAAQIAAATPEDRDRYLDLLRAIAIATVVVGHWLVAMVWVSDGALRAAAVIDVAPATRWLTWIVQVMPLFFLVGGVVNVRSWRTTRDAGGSYATWLARRAARLLRPTTVVVWTWLFLAPLATAAGVDRNLVVLGARSALVPLWFLGVYLLVIALVPVLLEAWRRLGLWLPAALVVAAAAIDATVRGAIPLLGLVNYLVVWSVPTVLGFAWADGRLERRAIRIGLPLAALAGLVVAVTWLGYPISMVGLAEQDAGGPNVPRVTLALLGCVQTGAALAMRARATTWLRRRGPWAAVVRANSVAMTVYLWHLTVLVLVTAALSLTGSWWSVTPLTGAWWLTRPLWLVGLALVLAPVVVALLPIERDAPVPRPRGGGPAATLGMVAAAAATSGAVAALTLGDVLGPAALPGGVVLTLAAVHTGAFRAPRPTGRLRRRRPTRRDVPTHGVTNAALCACKPECRSGHTRSVSRDAPNA